ncbi:MAG: hypothetical protein HWE30_19165 [Methylocystaceae bacterium]|nr:hypothetical protein [Methylocystaceae bacterium]
MPNASREIELMAGSDLPEADLVAVATMIKDGGAVKGSLQAIRERVRRAHLVAIARSDDQRIIAVAALKKPATTYRKGLSERSGYGLSEEKFPIELGYLTVLKEWRGPDVEGVWLSSVLLQKLMEKVGQRGAFATTKIERLCQDVLPDLGFEFCGTYKNQDNEEVFLLVRATPA